MFSSYFKLISIFLTSVHVSVGIEHYTNITDENYTRGPGCAGPFWKFFWLILDLIGQYLTNLDHSVCLDPSVWTHLFGPVYLDLSIWSRLF